MFVSCLKVVKVNVHYLPKCSKLEVSPTIAANVLALGEEADFEALNYLPALNLIRSTKLHLTTEPAFLPNACVRPA